MTTTYKNFHGTKAEYIAYLIERVQFWAKAFAEGGKHRDEWFMMLNQAEEHLAAEGYEWDEIEAIEIAAMQAA